MTKRFALGFGFFFLLIADALLSYCFVPDYQFSRLSCQFHLSFIALLVFTHDKPWPTRLFSGMLVGIITDLFFATGSFPYAFLMYGFLAWGCGLLGGVLDNPKIAVVVYLLAAGLLDFIPFVYAKMIAHTLDVGLLTWLYHMEFLTFIVNVFAVLVLMWCHSVMVRFFIIQNFLNQKEAQKASPKESGSSTSQPLEQPAKS